MAPASKQACVIVFFLNDDQEDQRLGPNYSAEEAEKSGEVDSFGRFVESPDLLDDSFAGRGFNGETDHQAKHGSAAIELFAENLLWVRGVGG